MGTPRIFIAVLLLSGCATSTGFDEANSTTDREWRVSAHYDGKRFYNTSGADKGAGDISQFLWQNLWNKEKWPKQVENPPADPIVARVTEGIRATYINHATMTIEATAARVSRSGTKLSASSTSRIHPVTRGEFLFVVTNWSV